MSDQFNHRQQLYQTTTEQPKIIVFCETKKGVDELVKSLLADGIRGVKGIHGDKC